MDGCAIVSVCGSGFRTADLLKNARCRFSTGGTSICEATGYASSCLGKKSRAISVVALPAGLTSGAVATLRVIIF